MKQFACRYTIIQFMPYTETGEFANIGVVLACPETGFFDFKLEMKRLQRVTDFFVSLDKKICTSAIQVMHVELMRIKEIIQQLPAGELRAEQVRFWMTTLTHPRETIIRFGSVRPCLTPSPEKNIGDLFKHYVEHSFATPEYVETSITKRIETLLKTLPLEEPFKNKKIGDEQFQVSFPLVQIQHMTGKAHKIIKPFDLSQKEPNNIFSHGDTWIKKIQRLRKRGLLPEKTLFAVQPPPQEDIKRFSAYTEICDELRQEHILLLSSSEESEIIQFARSE
jgi:hypothetical protein